MYQFHFLVEEEETLTISNKKPWTNPVLHLPLVVLALAMSGSLPPHSHPNVPYLPERPVPSELLLVPVAPRGGRR